MEVFGGVGFVLKPVSASGCQHAVMLCLYEQTSSRLSDALSPPIGFTVSLEPSAEPPPATHSAQVPIRDYGNFYRVVRNKWIVAFLTKIKQAGGLALVDG